MAYSDNSCRVCGKTTDGLPIAFCSPRCLFHSNLDREMKVLFLNTVFRHTNGTVETYKRNCKILPDWIRNDPNKHQVLRSNAGYYIGSMCEDGIPYARYTPYLSEERATFLFNTRRWVFIARETP